MRALRTNETRSRRLETLMCNFVFGALFLALSLGAMAFVATRTHMFHGALMRRQQNAENNVWLLQQCKSADFYSNMKQHSTLCDDVVLEQTDTLWLHALRDVIDNTYLCGELPCIKRVEQGLEWVFGRGVLLLAAMAGSSLLLFLIVVHIQRTLSGRMYDTHSMLQHPATISTWQQYPLLRDSEPNAARIRTRENLQLMT
jgi:hypothetical protein